jgi:hypothetical protein
VDVLERARLQGVPRSLPRGWLQRASSVICYCKNEIADTDRRIAIAVTLDWGADDLRDTTTEKTIDFCSFACVEAWAHDRALAHDEVVVTEGEANASV